MQITIYLYTALTRDIYRTENSQKMNAFHLNIKQCPCLPHQKINIAHLCQFRWMLTLQKRPNSILPTAHYLITFLNQLNISNVDASKIRDDFIIQCILSMHQNEWKEHLNKLKAIHPSTNAFNELLKLSEKSKHCKEFKRYQSKHEWTNFTKNAQNFMNFIDGKMRENERVKSEPDASIGKRH